MRLRFQLFLSVLALLAFAPSALGGVSVINEAGNGHASPALADVQSGLVRAIVLNPAGQSRTFRVRRARSAVRLLRYVADVDRDGQITRHDARRFTVARRLLHAADSVHQGGRNRLTDREILRYARRQAGRDRRFSRRELDRMLNRLGVPVRRAGRHCCRCRHGHRLHFRHSRQYRHRRQGRRRRPRLIR